jgi:hypothetical protein
MKTQFYRNCPKCKKLIFYKNEENRIKAETKQSDCASCVVSELNKIYKKQGWKKRQSKYFDINPPYIKNCPTCNCLMEYENKATFVYSVRDNKNCHSCANKNKNLGRIIRHYKRSENNKKNNRIAAIKRIEKNKFNGNQFYPSYNQNACRVIDKYGEENNCNFQHAMNGGEFHIKDLGYWVDGYDKQKNIVVECYEKHHYDKNGKLKIRDFIRQQEIIKFLNCKFISYNFNNGKFNECN